MPLHSDLQMRCCQSRGPYRYTPSSTSMLFLRIGCRAPPAILTPLPRFLRVDVRNPVPLVSFAPAGCAHPDLKMKHPPFFIRSNLLHSCAPLCSSVTTVEAAFEPSSLIPSSESADAFPVCRCCVLFRLAPVGGLRTVEKEFRVITFVRSFFPTSRVQGSSPRPFHL